MSLVSPAQRSMSSASTLATMPITVNAANDALQNRDR